MPKSNAIGAIIVSLLIFLTLGHQQAVNAETTFTINKSNTMATAIVSKQEFKVKIETMLSDYEKSLDKKLNFELVVGDCVLPIKAYEDGEGQVVFNVAQSSNKLDVTGPTLLTALPSQISFDGSSTGKPILCKVKFEKHPGDEKKFLINVELKGNDIPKNLRLILADPIFKKEDKADGFNIWIVLGPLIGVVSLIALIGLVVGVVLFCRYKKRKSEEPQQTPTFVLVESAKDKSSKPIQSSASKREIAQSEKTKSHKKEQKTMKAKKRSKESGDQKQADPPKQQSNCSTVPVKAKSVSSTQVLPKVVPSKAISQPSVEVVSQASVEKPVKYVFHDDYLLTKPPSEAPKSQEVLPPPAAPLLVKEVPKPAATDPLPPATDPLPAQLQKLREERAKKKSERQRMEREEKEAKKTSEEEPKKTSEEAKKTSEDPLPKQKVLSEREEMREQLQAMEQDEKKPKKTSEEQLTHGTCEEYDFVAEQRRQNEKRRKALEAGKLPSEATQEEGLIDN